ncbi:leukocyte-associated immunoglobulin-like receptor 1 isoform X2 [Peromyscus maniculatus bairdii]|uniref:leukocyte-associated immunoglobulin-like receptor 1 isoform X2 n=1 Tax=Peromyscus maniculatus bairdii TaxID=230844 RepID=UPI003FD0A5C5
MPVNPVKLLALGSLSKPSISAEPGLEISQGGCVTFVCSNPGGYDIFFLEKGSQRVMEKKNTQPPMTEARFLLGPVNESTAGDYRCIYYKKSTWSPRSETLELKVTREDVTQAPDPGSTVTSGGPSSRPSNNLACWTGQVAPERGARCTVAHYWTAKRKRGLARLTRVEVPQQHHSCAAGSLEVSAVHQSMGKALSKEALFI